MTPAAWRQPAGFGEYAPRDVPVLVIERIASSDTFIVQHKWLGFRFAVRASELLLNP